MKEDQSFITTIDLPGRGKEEIRIPGRFVLKDGFDFDMMKDLWSGIKKVLHKIGVL